MLSKEQIFNTIVQQTLEVLPDLEGRDFVETDSLRDLGANSIDRSEIIMMTMEELELNIPMIHMAKAENMGELAAIMAEKQ
jgi:polyketide biosynthesis acyl carrier protein